MRGEERRQRAMLMVMEPGDRVPKEHPLRRVKELADAALGQLSPLFDEMYSPIGRPSLPPERLLKASLLMALYTVRSERMFCEQLDYKLLFRWFLDMDVAEPSFDHSTFSRNRARLLEHDVAREFFTRVVRAPLQRDSSIDHRPRSETGEEGRRQGSEVVLLGQCADGEPQRSPDRVHGRIGRRLRRAQKCPGAAGDRVAGQPADYTRGR